MWTKDPEIDAYFTYKKMASGLYEESDLFRCSRLELRSVEGKYKWIFRVTIEKVFLLSNSCP